MCLRQALVDMSEHAAKELARGSAALGRVAELEARVAELEARSHHLEADKVKAEDALCKEKHGKESERCLSSSLHTVLSLTCFCLELEACTMANEELQKLREVAEAREAATEAKLRLEREARRGMTQRSYAMFVLSCSSAWADPAGGFLQKRRSRWRRAG